MKTDIKKLKELWQAEENTAHIHGWDFSHIKGKYKCCDDNLPWDYGETVKHYLTPNKKLLDIDTGGGEFLLSLKHPCDMTSATEGYPPNIELCKKTLTQMGIDFRETNDYNSLPFDDESFDIVINRHGSYNITEISRILKKEGIFITQQVGEQNDRELIDLICPNAAPQFSGWNLKNEIAHFEKQNFSVLQQGEHFGPIEFYDTSALIWFAKIIEWEFIGFSVESSFEQLCNVHRIITEQGAVKGRIHRFLIVVQKSD